MNVWKSVSVGGVLLGMMAAGAEGAVFQQLGSSVQAYFGSQGNAYTDSNPVAGPWGTPGVGPYPAGAGIPGVPVVTPPIVYPTYTGNPFQVPGGYTSVFVDNLGGTTSYAAAQITTTDWFNPAGTSTADAQVLLAAGRLAQGPTAPSYAYLQVNFAADYGVTSNPTGLTAASPAIPLTVSGQVALGGYAQFDAVIDYWWIPATGIGFTPTGPAQPLGSLTYSWLQIGGGPFLQTLTSTGALSATPSGQGILELTGHMWIAGDPFDLQVTGVPEPASLGVLGAGGVVLMRRRGRR